VTKLTSTGSVPKPEELGKFADGTPAITCKAAGDGRIVHFAWLPGLSESMSYH
jgi:hypothetical protein